MQGVVEPIGNILKKKKKKQEYMSKISGTIVVDTERCKGCGLCVEACPKKIVEMTTKAVNKKGYPYATQKDSDLCNGCTACAIVCPDGCITVYRKKWKEEE